MDSLVFSFFSPLSLPQNRANKGKIVKRKDTYVYNITTNALAY
jgi:hypothetical protein